MERLAQWNKINNFNERFFIEDYFSPRLKSQIGGIGFLCFVCPALRQSRIFLYTKMRAATNAALFGEGILVTLNATKLIMYWGGLRVL